MKKLFSLSIMLMFALTTMFAQDIAKEAKALTRAITAAKGDATKLGGLESKLMNLFSDGAAMKNATALIAKGNYYSALAGIDFDAATTAGITGATAEVNYAGSATKAFEAYSAAIPLIEKASKAKPILENMAFLQNFLRNDLNHAIGQSDWENVYGYAKQLLGLNDFLIGQGKDPVVAEEFMPEMNNTVVYGASKLASQYFESGDEAKATMFLEEAKSIDPENTELLFTEINILLKKGDNAKLETLLNKAIEKQPDNPSIYLILGNVYRQQFEAKMEGGMKADAEEAFTKAEGFYTKSHAVDNSYSQGLYSIGEMWYNKAAFVSQDLQELSSDFSKEGLAKAEMLQDEMKDYFKKALPFFKDAEKLDPNNRNNLILLKEALVRIDDYETSAKVKARIEAIEAGEKFDSSLF